MASGDWIKLHRRLLDNPIMQHDGICRLWIYCLMRANWKPSKWMVPGTTSIIDVPRGAFITGRYELHAALYPKRGRGRHTADIPSESTVWRWLLSLEQMQCINVSNVNNRCTMVTVCKYGTYQDDKRDDRTAGEQPVNNWRTAGEQPVNTEEERKEIQEGEEEKEKCARADQTGTIGKIRLHEAAFKPMLFRSNFDALKKLHPVPTNGTKAEIEWRQVATDDDAVKKIESGHAAYRASPRWLDGKGIPNLERFLSERWFDNPPEPEKQRDNLKRTERTSARYDPAVHG